MFILSWILEKYRVMASKKEIHKGAKYKSKSK